MCTGVMVFTHLGLITSYPMWALVFYEKIRNDMSKNSGLCLGCSLDLTIFNPNLETYRISVSGFGHRVCVQMLLDY